MATFSEAVERADATGLPVAEGFAVQHRDGADAAAVTALIAAELAARFPGHEGPAESPSDRWLVFRGGGAAPVPLGAAWDAVRALRRIPGVETAEPLLLVRQPVTNGSD